MKVTLNPTKLAGSVRAIPSKSMAHRLLICAALTEGVQRIRCEQTCEDIDATISCLKAMGSNIVKIGNYYIVPKVTAMPGQSVTLDCNESGTTLRFMMCIAAGLGLCAKFKGSDRLFARPLSPLEEVLTDHGIVITRDESGRIIQSGKAFGQNYEISGDVSSQFISGLLMMLPLCKGVSVTVTGDFESKPYVDLTVSAMRTADINVEENGRTYTVRGRYDLRDTIVEGDWSNSAFFLCAKALGCDVQVENLKEDSLQGDRGVLLALSELQSGKDIVEINAKDIPDLVPVLSVVAALTKCRTIISGAQRLTLKESDRLQTVCKLITDLGGNCEVTPDGLIIDGKEKLTGGEVQGCNDHRIVMSAAIASIGCENPVVINGAQAVNKSYPAFFDDFVSLGGKIEVEE